jgi:hypothetical protein
LECQPSSHQTGEHSLSLIFGTHCVFCYRSSTSRPPPTTPGQGNGGEATLPPEGCLTCPWHHHDLGRQAALGAPGPSVTPRGDANISPAQALYGTPLELPNQDINNEHTINKFIIPIDKILKNHPIYAQAQHCSRKGAAPDDLADAAIQLQHTVASTASIAVATPLPPSPTTKSIAAVSTSSSNRRNYKQLPAPTTSAHDSGNSLPAATPAADTSELVPRVFW